MHVTFYELSEGAETDAQAMHKQVIEIVAEHYRQRRYLTLICKDKSQAEEIDELIWQQPADLFIAHSLSGEGPANGSPVDITWLEALDGGPVRNKKWVINVSASFLSQFASFGHLIDFVPKDEKAKAEARERYKQYKQAGCEMRFVNAK